MAPFLRPRHQSGCSALCATAAVASCPARDQWSSHPAGAELSTVAAAAVAAAASHTASISSSACSGWCGPGNTRATSIHAHVDRGDTVQDHATAQSAMRPRLQQRAQAHAEQATAGRVSRPPVALGIAAQPGQTRSPARAGGTTKPQQQQQQQLTRCARTLITLPSGPSTWN